MNAILDPAGPRAVAEEAKKTGRIKHIGVTSHTMDIAKQLVKSGYFETIMFPFNFMTNEAAQELLPLIRARDMGFIAMKPFSGGMITDVTLSIKYLWQFPDIVTIPGIEKVPEIEEIVRIVNGPLTMSAAEKKEMVRLKEELGDKFCRRCDYCQPCTEGIPISAIMHVEGTLKRTPPAVYIRMLDEPMAKAANCIKCGECETRCPYHLPIREMVEENVKRFQKAKEKYLASK
jgi:predicted aldo/keto reductase-like oxidoreductase